MLSHPPFLRTPRSLALACGLLAVLLTVGACDNQTPDTQTSGKLKVVATFSILGDMVHQVAGPDADLLVLVGPDADAHAFQPDPADGAMLADADVLFENGLGFECWLGNLYSASGSHAQQVVVSKDITPRFFNEEGIQGKKPDPHAWQSVANAELMVKQIIAALVQRDPAHAKNYTQRGERYLAQLAALDRAILAQTQALPKADRLLVTSHDALGYFADAYDFKVVGNGLESATTVAADPSAADMARLVADIRARHIPAVFIENMTNAKVVQQIGREAGVKIAPPLYTDALGKAGTPGETYLGMMAHNARVITESLQP